MLGCVRVCDLRQLVDLINALSSATAFPLLHPGRHVAREFGAASGGMVASMCLTRCMACMAWRWRISLGDMHAYARRCAFTPAKSIRQRWPESISKGAEFVMPTAK